MAKYPALKKFRDRDSGEILEIGDEISIEDKDRVAKLQEGGWIGEEINPVPKKAKQQAGETDGAEADQPQKVRPKNQTANKKNRP